jgi:hypothetical protein
LLVKIGRTVWIKLSSNVLFIGIATSKYHDEPNNQTNLANQQTLPKPRTLPTDGHLTADDAPSLNQRTFPSSGIPMGEE